MSYFENKFKVSERTFYGLKPNEFCLEHNCSADAWFQVYVEQQYDEGESYFHVSEISTMEYPLNRVKLNSSIYIYADNIEDFLANHEEELLSELVGLFVELSGCYSKLAIIADQGWYDYYEED